MSRNEEKLNPWRWEPHTPPHIRHCLEKRNCVDGYFPYDEEHGALDIHTKVAVLHISPSVVSLLSYHDDSMVCACSGTIVQSTLCESGAQYASLVLTSVSLLRSNVGSCYDPSSLKVIVNLWEGSEPCEGKIIGFNEYYSVAVVEVRSSSQLPTAILGRLDIDSTELPMQSLIAVGRHYSQPHDIMAARGTLTYAYNFREEGDEPVECLRASCRISRVGIGGPLINNHGEVIGLNFYHDYYTPFLPVKIASKCLDLLTHHGPEHYSKLVEEKLAYSYSWPGIQVSSLAAANMSLLEKIIQWHPNCREGVLVEKVILGSSADVAGIRPADVILKCAGKSVTCSEEFFDIILEKAGEDVDITVARMGGNANLKLVPQ